MKLIETLAQARTILMGVVEVLAAFVALIVLVYLLLGADAGGFVLSVVTNLTLLIQAFTPQVLVALALVFGIALLLRRRG